MAATVDLVIPTGATWKRLLVWSNADGTRRSLAGFRALMQIRCAPPEPVVLTLSSAPGGGMTLEQESVKGDPTGVLALTLSGAASRAVAAAFGDYDLLLQTISASDGEPSYRLIEGKVTFDLAITRPV